jgi:hypothetical protein
VGLRFHVRVIIQRAGPDKDHPWPVFDTRKHVTSTGLAEIAMFSGRGLKGYQIFFSNNFESFGFSDQNGRECSACHFPAIGTMTIGKHKQLAVYFILNSAAITATFNHNSISFGPTVSNT